MSRREVSIEIFAPTEGLHTEVAKSILTVRATPSVECADAYYGVVQKDYGTSLYCAGTMPGKPNLFFEAPYSTATVLYGFTSTGIYKNSGTGFAACSPAYTGTFSDWWQVCMHNDETIACNKSINPVQYISSPTATATNMAGVMDTTLKANACVSFKEHLNLYNVTESGNKSPKRAQWTKAGLLGHTASDWTTGYSGFVDIQDVEGDIHTALPMGYGVVMIYAEGSVHAQEWIGGSTVYSFTKMFGNLDIPTPRGIVANDAIHYVFTRTGIFEYKGGSNWKDISEPIKADLFALINPNAYDQVFLSFVKEDNELEVHVPTVANTSPDTVWVCKISESYSWWKKTRAYTAAGKSSRAASLTIGELVGNIGAQNWRFGDLRVNQGATEYLYSDPTGHVAKRDKTVYSVISSGTSIAQTFKFNTKALTSINDIDPYTRDKYGLTKYMDNETRWIQAVVEAKGDGSLYMNYSTDEGGSWVPCPENPKSLNSEWDIYEFDVDVVSPSIMLQPVNTGLNEVLHLRYMKVDFVPGSEA